MSDLPAWQPCPGPFPCRLQPVLKVWDDHAVPYALLDAAECRERFQQFHMADDEVSLAHPHTARVSLRVEACTHPPMWKALVEVHFPANLSPSFLCICLMVDVRGGVTHLRNFFFKTK